MATDNQAAREDVTGRGVCGPNERAEGSGDARGLGTPRSQI
jgi:hypothetical protein